MNNHKRRLGAILGLVIVTTFLLTLLTVMTNKQTAARTLYVENLPNPKFMWGKSETRVETILSDGQFVYGPNVGDFSVGAFLQQQSSALEKFTSKIECAIALPSVNPKVILVILEMQGYQVTTAGLFQETESSSEESFSQYVETLAQTLAKHFYWHLFEYTPKSGNVQVPLLVTFADGTSYQIKQDINAGTYAILATLAESYLSEEWTIKVGRDSQDGFYQTFLRLFPDDDPLDTSNVIEPFAAPPGNLLQFPFPRGEHWNFNGTHGWAGYDTPFSSMDFSRGWPACGGSYSDYGVVAAADGDIYKPNSYVTCWIRINHQDGWTTSYYHLTNLQRASGSITKGSRFADIGCETCVGGTADSAHVHCL